MNTVLAFDIYGTLIDTHGVSVELEKLVGDRAAEFSQRWRDKQLEYTFRRGLMGKYVDFSVCTRQALDYVAEQFSAELTEQQKLQLMERYASLPVFDDVISSLSALHKGDCRMYAFSNGTAEGVAGLLHHTGIRDYFDDIISVDEIHSYKPDPTVYHHFLSRSGGTPASSWLISSNPFDIIGAAAVGMQTAWIQRQTNAIFDPWEVQPNVTIGSLTDLADIVHTS